MIKYKKGNELNKINMDLSQFYKIEKKVYAELYKKENGEYIGMINIEDFFLFGYSHGKINAYSIHFLATPDRQFINVPLLSDNITSNIIDSKETVMEVFKIKKIKLNRITCVIRVSPIEFSSIKFIDEISNKAVEKIKDKINSQYIF